MTSCEDLTTLDVTGVREGRRVVVARAVVLDDHFTKTELAVRAWNLKTVRPGVGYARAEFRLPDGSWKSRPLHQIVYECYFGPVPDGLVVDHEDQNRLNCLPWNLRAITQSENVANSGCRRANTSGYKGVSWHAGGRKWQAVITVRGKAMGLGLFVDKEDAARAINAAYRIYFPGVAVPNPEVG